MPKVNVSGENFNVGGIKELVANLLGWVKMLGFALLFADDMIFKAIFGEEQQQPQAVKDFRAWLAENKMAFGAMTFFGVTVFQNGLLQSGAFEMYINDKLVFSKLQSGDMPSIEIINSLMADAGLVL